MQAAPHISGIVAACRAPGGLCEFLNVADTIKRVVSLAKCVQSTHGWSADPACAPNAAKYYGYMAIGGIELRGSLSVDQCPPPPVDWCVVSDNLGVINSGTYAAATGVFTNLAYTYTSTLSGECNMIVSISGGTGDADLYIQKNARPTRTSYAWRPYLVRGSSPAAARQRHSTGLLD